MAERPAHASGAHTGLRRGAAVPRALCLLEGAAEAGRWKQTGSVAQQQREAFDILRCSV